MIDPRRWIAFTLGLVVFGCEIDPSHPPSAAPPRSPEATTPATPPATAPAPSRTPAPVISCVEPATSPTLIAYADAADLWVYDVDADDPRALTGDGDARVEWGPVFLTGACLAFMNSEPSSIELLDLSNPGLRRTIVEERGRINAFDISPDRRSVLYLHIDHDVDGTYRLKRVGIDGGSPEVLHTFDPNVGRGAGSEDEVSVAFSPDGALLLVTNTHESSPAFPYGAIYLFDGSATQVLERWTGTHPRWSPDGGTIYYRGHAGINGQRWSALGIETKEVTRLAVTPGTNGLAVSPDGRRLAYDTSIFGDTPAGIMSTGEAPTVGIYDLATNKEVILQPGAMGPLWITNRAVLATNVREPTTESWNSWESLGTVSRITVGGARTPVGMTSTLFDAEVHIGT